MAAASGGSQTEGFMIFGFKIIHCGQSSPHDWSTCPLAHNNEKARRRDPRVYDYLPDLCQTRARKLECPYADACPYAHNVYESWLHPLRYRTQMCRYGMSCVRPLCFFAHSPEEFREPQTVATWWQQQRLAAGFPPQVAAPPQLPMHGGSVLPHATMGLMGAPAGAAAAFAAYGDPHAHMQQAMQMQVLMQQAAAAMYQPQLQMQGSQHAAFSAVTAAQQQQPLMMQQMMGLGMFPQHQHQQQQQQQQQQHQHDQHDQQEQACTYDRGGYGSVGGPWGGAPGKQQPRYNGGGRALGAPRGAPQRQERHPQDRRGNGGGADELAESLRTLDLGVTVAGSRNPPSSQQQPQQPPHQRAGRAARRGGGAEPEIAPAGDAGEGAGSDGGAAPNGAAGEHPEAPAAGQDAPAAAGAAGSAAGDADEASA